MSPRVRRALGLAFDLAAIWAVLYVRGLAQVRLRPDHAIADDLPAWWWSFGALHDLVLSGADAGAWAANVEQLLAGGTLDIHRMPTWTWLAAGMTKIFDDVVFAGHMLNHLLSALVPVAAYLLGRWTSGRAAGLGAALLTAFSHELVNSKSDFGVDPALQFFVLLLALCAWGAIRGPVWMVLAAGAVAGVAAGTHYLALVFVPVAAVLLLLRPAPWIWRWTLPLVCLGVAFGTWKLLLWPYPDISLSNVASIYAEGVAGSGGRGAEAGALSLTDAIDRVLARSQGALRLAVQRGLRGLAVEGMPWMGLVAAFWVGLVGPGLGRDSDRWRWDWRSGLLIAGFLSPLVLLEAARAPDRYALFSRPLLFLAVARGIAVVGAGADALIRRKLAAWPRGILAGAAILAGVAWIQAPLRSNWRLFPPTEKGLLVREAGLTIRDGFGPGGGVATSNRELAWYAGRSICPDNPCPPDGDLARCVSLLLSQCDGSGDLPYVVEIRDQRGFGDQPNADQDRLIDERFDQLDTLTGREITLKLYTVDRAAARALVQELGTE